MYKRKQLETPSALSSRRNDRPHKIQPVDRCRHGVERRDFTLQRVHAQGPGAGANQHGCAAVAFAGERKSELDMGARFERDVRMEENATAGDVAKLPGMEIRRTMLRQADLNWQVN